MSPSVESQDTPSEEQDEAVTVAQADPDSPDEMAALQADLAERQEQILRLHAEMENLRRRTERELENAHKYALDRFTQELLPVRDSLELGLSAAAADDADLTKLLEGSELTLKMLATAMEKFGIREIDPHGEPFDPEAHQAMAMQPADHVEPNTVLTVIQKGYKLNDRLVRPALVTVAKAVEPPPEAPQIDEHA